jgi:hypothetical protein
MERMILHIVSLLQPHFSQQAYLDPGSGSIIIQLLIAGLMAVGIVVKVFWKRIKGFFNRSTPEKEDDNQIQP